MAKSEESKQCTIILIITLVVIIRADLIYAIFRKHQRGGESYQKNNRTEGGAVEYLKNNASYVSETPPYQTDFDQASYVRWAQELNRANATEDNRLQSLERQPQRDNQSLSREKQPDEIAGDNVVEAVGHELQRSLRSTPPFGIRKKPKKYRRVSIQNVKRRQRLMRKRQKAMRRKVKKARKRPKKMGKRRKMRRLRKKHRKPSKVFIHKQSTWTLGKAEGHVNESTDATTMAAQQAVNSMASAIAVASNRTRLAGVVSTGRNRPAKSNTGRARKRARPKTHRRKTNGLLLQTQQIQRGLRLMLRAVLNEKQRVSTLLAKYQRRIGSHLRKMMPKRRTNRKPNKTKRRQKAAARRQKGTRRRQKRHHDQSESLMFNKLMRMLQAKLQRLKRLLVELDALFYGTRAAISSAMVNKINTPSEIKQVNRTIKQMFNQFEPANAATHRQHVLQQADAQLHSIQRIMRRPIIRQSANHD